MIIIDGDYGSGGGQILRTAIGLAALTGTACRIEKVRAKRPHPGLREQHLQAAIAVASICKGRLEGGEIGSTEVEFYPGQIKSGNISISISTAGSVGLVLQALLIPAMQADLNIEIKGGATYVVACPLFIYDNCDLKMEDGMYRIVARDCIFLDGKWEYGKNKVYGYVNVSGFDKVRCTELLEKKIVEKESGSEVWREVGERGGLFEKFVDIVRGYLSFKG